MKKRLTKGRGGLASTLPFLIGALLAICACDKRDADGKEPQGRSKSAEEIEEATAGRATWVEKIGGPDHPLFGGDSGTGIAVSPDGSVYVVGVITGRATFHAGHHDETVLDTGAYWRKGSFLSRWSEQGDLRWVVSLLGRDNVEGTVLAVGPDGSPWVAGRCAGTTKLGSTSGQGLVLSCGGERNLFVARYSGEGVPEWVARMHGNEGLDVGGIVTGRDGALYLAGTHSGRIAFTRSGSAEPYHELTSVAGGRKAFVTRFLKDGSLTWVRSFAGGGGESRATGLAAGESGGVVVTGSFTESLESDGSASLGSAPTHASLSSRGGKDLFLMSVNRNGATEFSVSAGGPGDDEGRVVSCGRDGKVALLGNTAGNATFGGSGPGETLHRPSGMFISHFNDDGSFTSIYKLDASGRAMVLLEEGTTVAAGCYLKRAVFGRGQEQKLTLTGLGEAWPEDAFVVRHDSEGTPLWAMSAGGPRHFMAVDRSEGIGDCALAVAANGDQTALYVTGFFYGKSYFGRAAGGYSVLTSPRGFDAFVMRLNP